MTLREWAAKWGVSTQAVIDLEQQMGLHAVAPVSSQDRSEAAMQQLYRMEAARRGELLWRNNVGALLDERGVPVRYGLCNDTKELNARLKSSDLVGPKPVLIEQRHVGTVIAQFKCREMKEENWTYTGTPRERAQLNYIELVVSKGGDAAFATGPDWD